jgi:Response regulators consisting of a CheY-like receiver domain and a winged-helix DNA-binding domain
MPTSPKILYVDDELDNREMMRYWLKLNCGLDVTTAHDGHSAMEYIGREFFDIYLLDYGLPDTTGVELLKNIKKLDPTAYVIMYSALDRDVDRERSLTAGADMYLVKPDDMEQIKPVLDRLLKKSAERKTPTSNASSQLDPASPLGRPRRKDSGIM